ncbi:MAG: diacylglycerol kinase [Gammaproteobacteria bacterium]|nr:diacylglycerol kinase [Gammaproteobacteria bacterium]
MNNKISKGGEIARLIRAFGYSLAGIKSAFQNEAAFRLEVALFTVLAPLALWLGDNGTERALLLGSLMLVLIAEVINSSIEAVVDRIGTEQHTLAGRAKDMGSGAVLLTLVNAALIWALVLLDRLHF